MKKNNIFNSTLITGYLFLLSIAYLWGFWGNFQINILQFISVQDILKASIIPMIVTLVLYFAQVAINNFNSPKGDIKNLTDLSKQEKIDVGIKISYVVIISLLTLISIIHALFFGSLMQRYSVAGFIAALTLSIALGQKKEIMEYLPGKNKILTLSILCFVPVVFLNRGVHDGEKIKEGKDTFIVESNSKCTNDSTTKYRYIDSLSDKVFALSLKDQSICIFKYEYIKLIKEKKATERAS